MAVSTREQAHRERDIANAITGTIWCVGRNHAVPLAKACTYRGKPYCLDCRAKARARR